MRTEQTTLYEADFVEWTAHTAQLLRERRFDDLDIEHIAEEIEEMGKSDWREIENRLTVLLTHLLKWQFQPERRGRSWQLTIANQRVGMARLIRDSPSLKPYLVTALDECYADAVRIGTIATGLTPDRFPEVCPYNAGQILDADYLP